MYNLKHLIIVVVITVLIAGGVGYWLGQVKLFYGPKVAALGQDTFKVGMETAYNRLIARGHADVVVLGYGFLASKTIGGLIKEISSGKIILTVKPVSALADPALDERAVTIGSRTKIYKQVAKTAEQLQKDMEGFNKKMIENKDKQNAQPLTPPEPFVKQEISISELKAGQQISITAASNIHDQQEFSATEILWMGF